jgi:hypothetical protein
MERARRWRWLSLAGVVLGLGLLTEFLVSTAGPPTYAPGEAPYRTRARRVPRGRSVTAETADEAEFARDGLLVSPDLLPV